MTDETPTTETPTSEPAPTAPARSRGTVRAWLQLIRIPALFTAIADIAAGFAAKTGGFEPVGQLASLLTASGCLYIAGMILNDVFDRKRDLEFRANRPIPSGQISVQAATGLAVVLMIAGIASAWSVSWQAFYIALGLTLCILAYDGLLKSMWLGPLAMGACRFLNVMLGAAVDDIASTVWTTPQLFVAAAIGVYVVGITWFARSEERTSHRANLIGGATVVNLGMAMLAGLYYGLPGFPRPSWGAELNGTLLACFVLAVAVTINRRLIQAIGKPSPYYVQAAVKLMLISIITLDATVVLASTGALVPAVAVALLILPAFYLGRWLYVT